MLFSERFSITPTRADDWFDLILDADTELFVDPFLIFKEPPGPRSLWAGAHDEIVGHFQHVFEQLAMAECRPAALRYRVAVGAVTFPEPREFCLGYTAVGTRGSGSGEGLARLVAKAMCEAIERGKLELRHFEELGILNEGIGPDRISDLTCTVLKPRFVRYTQRVASRHGVPLTEHQLRAGMFDRGELRWKHLRCELPTNPATKGPVLLTPERFLAELPTLNPDDWWTSQEAQELRDRFNLDVMRNADKKTIVSLARRDPHAVEEWTRRRERDEGRPYDIGRDRKGVYGWDARGRQFATDNPLVLNAPSTDEDFFALIELVVSQFRHFVEEEGGWELLWDGTEPKAESAAQLLFRGIARHYCAANDINLDQEVRLGSGAVDFKFSNGYQRRALLEVKKLDNGRFWNGLYEQLPAYLGSDDCRDGWFLAVRYREGGVSRSRARELPGEVKAAAQRHHVRLRHGLVDARRPIPPSRRRRGA